MFHAAKAYKIAGVQTHELRWKVKAMIKEWGKKKRKNKKKCAVAGNIMYVWTLMSPLNGHYIYA